MAKLVLKSRHRVMCGDSTDATMVSRLIDGAKVSVCLTDPPYGIGDTTSDKNNYDQYDDSRENLVAIVAGFLPIAREVAECVVITPGNGNQSIYPPPTWTMAWFTPAGVGRGPWGFCCWQPIICYGKDPKLSRGKGCYPDAIVHTESAEKSVHPCPKPVNFWSWLMERVSEPGEVIYEPFCGSGTGIISAETTGRRCYAMEISPAYVDVAVRRWQAFTGQEAVLHADGRSFDDVAAGRQQEAA